MIPPAAILAGGMATRLYPVTKKIPKSLLEIDGHPFIFHQLALLRREGIKKAVICAGNLGDQIIEAVKDGSELGIEVKYSFDGDKLLGTGGALRKALLLLGESFWVIYGDSYLDIDFRPVFDAFNSQGKPGLMTVYENEDKWVTSNVEFRDGRLFNYDKANHTPEMHHLDYGLTLLKKEALMNIPEGVIIDLADTYRGLVQSGNMAGYEIFTRFYEVGTPEGIRDLTEYIRKNGSAYKP